MDNIRSAGKIQLATVFLNKTICTKQDKKMVTNEGKCNTRKKYLILFYITYHKKSGQLNKVFYRNTLRINNKFLLVLDILAVQFKLLMLLLI